MDLHFSLIGLNHRSAGVDIRERFSLAEAANSEAGRFSWPEEARELLILSTCNRVELLAIGATDTSQALLEGWARNCNADPEELKRYIYTFRNLDAARHVFEVASSLDSMILGEPQILGQIKAAYRKSVERKQSGAVLSRLMHKAFSIAKRVRHETAVAASAVSISYAAVELAKRIFGAMPAHKAMLIGAGEMAELAATHLLQAGVDEILVANRTLERGEELARRFHGRAIPFDHIAESLHEVDIVIASTGSKEPVLDAETVRKTLRRRKNRPMFFIDIAVPRDIDASVNALDNVYLYDIDDLKDVVEENMASRREEAARARLIIDEELAQFAAWLENLAAEPTIMDLIHKGEEAAYAEVARALKRLGPVDAATGRTLELMALGIAKKLIHDPIMYLKKSGMGCDGPHERINIVRRIFALDKDKPGQGT